MILGYLKCGQKALEIYQQMQHEAVQPDTITFIGVINACASVMALEEGRHIHEQIKQCGSEWNIFVASSLVDVYAKCGSIEDAWKLFNSMATHDVVSWNAMILGFVQCGKAEKALDLFRQMQREGVQPVAVTFIGVLNACSDLQALEEGRHIHTQVVQSGCESDSFVSNSLVDIYSKCGSIEDAQRVFEMMPTHDVVSWIAMILGYVKCVKGRRASTDAIRRVDPDHVTFVRVINACASITALNDGRRIHEQIVQNGFESDVVMGNSLVDMYGKCGNMETAQSVSEDAHTQRVCLECHDSGIFKCGQGKFALEVKNATGGSAARFCHLCRCAKCMCQCDGTGRRQAHP
jgi:pentatricopeptide repeat protein